MAAGADETYSIYRSIVIDVSRRRGEAGARSAAADWLSTIYSVNILIKTFNPSAAFPNDEEVRAFWQRLLLLLCRLSHIELEKIIDKYFVSLNERAIESLGDIPISFDLTSKSFIEVRNISDSLEKVVSCDVIQYPGDQPEVREDRIDWDPSDIKGSIENLPSPGKWSQRTSSSIIHVLGAPFQAIGETKDYEIHVVEKEAADHQFQVVYYSFSLFEGLCAAAWGDIILLYPGYAYCEWQVRQKCVTPALEIYGVNPGKHELKLAPVSLDMGNSSLIEASYAHQPLPLYLITSNLTITSRNRGSMISVSGGECHMSLTKTCFNGKDSCISFSPARNSSLRMHKCVATGSMDTCIILGSPSTRAENVSARLIGCKVYKNGRGYHSKPGASPAIKLFSLTHVLIEDCKICDNVGHALQYGDCELRPESLQLRGNQLKRNQACSLSTSGGGGGGSCCSREPAGPAPTSGVVRGLDRGRSCFVCGNSTNKICNFCKNAFYCNIQCQMEDWTKRHQFYCVS